MEVTQPRGIMSTPSGCYCAAPRLSMQLQSWGWQLLPSSGLKGLLTHDSTGAEAPGIGHACASGSFPDDAPPCSCSCFLVLPAGRCCCSTGKLQQCQQKAPGQAADRIPFP